MAIHCIRPNDIAKEAADLYQLTASEGKILIQNFAQVIESLKNDWKGTDASANIKSLISAYSVVSEFVKLLQKMIVEVNNNEILPLQTEIVKSGGTCTIGESLGESLTDLSTLISDPEETTESRVEDNIIKDAETFNSFPEDLARFKDNIDGCKEILLGNWKEGGNIAAVIQSFNDFDNQYAEFSPKVIQVRDNLNTVAENKRPFLNA